MTCPSLALCYNLTLCVHLPCNRKHWALCILVHTIIAARYILHAMLENVDQLVHKGFFDNRDRDGIADHIVMKLLELEQAIDHHWSSAFKRWLRRKLCHKANPEASVDATRILVHAAHGIHQADRDGSNGSHAPHVLQGVNEPRAEPVSDIPGMVSSETAQA